MKQFRIQNCGWSDSKVIVTLKGVAAEKDADLGLELA